LCGAFLVECSRADGLLVWPVRVLLGFFLRIPKRARITTAIAGMIAVGFYWKGYHTPAQQANSWTSIQHLLAIAKFCHHVFRINLGCFASVVFILPNVRNR
jgi:hypothetical protein